MSSNPIDQRVVQMEFDNARFERNIKTSTESIDKLTKSLDIKNSAKGLDAITESARKINLSGVSSAVDTISVKLSAMQVMATTAIANITNSAVNAGKRIISSLTIDPVKLGLTEYETQMNAVQTILANTSSKGTTLEQVNSALNELNHYADMTIYNFTQMTRNIGTFTAAGVGLKESVSAIKGIANLAAVSGSNAEQASTAMYQLSQALAAGTVKLQDWNSVVNAGMGGEVFQNALKDTARVHGVAIDAMIKKEGSFRETLKDGWVTSSVLTETLAKFTGDLNEEQLKSIGYTQEQVDAIIKMGKTANDAATKVKTFTQLIDTLQEAAQSGWTQSWQIVIGNFEEAKDLFTQASDTLGALINASANARNELLTSGLMSEWGRFSETWASTMGDGIAGVEAYKETIKSVASEQGIQVDKMIQESGSFEKSLKSGWLTADIMNESLARLTNKMSNLSEQELQSSGYTTDHVKALKQLNSEVKDGSISLGNFSDKIENMSGREHLIRSISNSFKALISVVKPVHNAFRDLFPPLTGEKLFNMTVALDNFTSHLILSDKNAVNLQRTFKGIFSIVNLFTTVISSGLNVGLKITGKLFGITATNVLDVTAVIGDLLSNFRDWVLENNIVIKGLNKLSDGLINGISSVTNFLNALYELPIVQKNMEKFGSAFSDDMSDIHNYLSGGANQITLFIERVKMMDSLSLNNIGDVIKDFKVNVVGYFLDIDSVFSRVKKTIAEFKSDIKKHFTDTGDSFDGLQIKMASFLNFTSTKFNKFGLGELLTVGLGISLILIIKKIGNFIDALARPLGSLGDISEGLISVLKSVNKVIKAYAMQLQANAILKIAEAIAVLAGSIALLTLLDQGKMWSAVGALGALAGGLMVIAGVMGALNKFTNFTGATRAIVGLSASLLIMATALKQMEGLDPNKALNNVLILGVMAAELGLVVGVLSLIAPKLSSGSLLLISFATSLKVMVKALQDLEGIKQENISKSLDFMLSAMAGLALVAAAASKVKFGGAATILAASVSLKILVGVIDDISEIDMSKIKNNIGGFITVFGLFSGLMLVTRLAGSNALKAGTAIVAISSSLLIMSAAIKSVNRLNSSEIGKGIVAVGAMALLYGAVIALSKLAGSNAVKAGVMISLMSGAILALTVSIAVLSKLNPTGIDQAVEAIIKMELAFGLIIGMTKLAKDCKSTLVVISATIGILSVALATLSLINGDNLDNATKAMSLVMGMFAVIVGASALATSAVGTLAVMAIIIAELAAVLYVLSGLDVNTTIGIAASLSVLLLSLSASLLILSGVGAVIQPALLGIVALDAFILDLGAVLVGLGALTEQIPKVEEWLNKGIPVLEKIGYAFGSFIGNIIGGIAAGSTSNLTEIGQNLTKFMVSLSPFFILVRNVDSDSISGVKMLAETLLILTGADILTKLTAWATGGKALSSFGTELTAFGTEFKKYADSVSGISNMDVVNSSAVAAKALAELANNLPNSGGLAGFFAGENDFATFSKGLVEFGSSLMDYSLSVTGLNADVVTNSANGAKALAELANNLPNSGGLAAFFAGENDFATFSKGLVEFGQSLMSYSNSVTGLRIDSIEGSVTASKLLSELMSNMPNSGGLVSLFSGDNTFKSFSKGLSSFGQSLMDYGNSVVGLQLKAIDDSVKAANTLGKLSNIDLSGIVNFTNMISVISNTPINEQAINAAANIMQSFINGISNKEEDVISELDTFVSKIQNGLNSANNLYSNFKNTGEYLVQGFVEGMNNSKNSVSVAAANLGEIANKATREALDIHSPSGEGRSTGEYYGAGLVEGVKNSATNVYNAAKNLGTNVKNGAETGIKGNITDFVSGVKNIFGGLGKAGSDAGTSSANGVAEGLKKGASKVKKATKTLYDITKDWIDEEKYYHRLSLDEELAKWEEVQAKVKVGSEERKKIDREVYRVKKEIIEDTFKTEKEYIDDERYYKRATLNDELAYWIKIQEKYTALGDEYNAQRNEADRKVFKLREEVLEDTFNKEKEWIDDKKYYGQLSLSEELSYWKGIQKQFLAGTKEREDANKQVYKLEKDLAKEAFDNAKNWISERKYYNELSLKEELYAWEKMQDVYEEGTDERKEADREVYRLEREIDQAKEQNAKDIAEVESDAAQKRKDLEQDYYDKTKEVNDKLKQDIDDVNQKYDDAVKSRADTISKAYNLFDYAKIGNGVEGQVLLDNLGSQITAMDDWKKDINSLANRGIADGLLEELRNMGPSSAAEIKALNSLTDEQLNQYVSLWQQKEAMAKDQALLELEDMKKETAIKISELTNVANQQLEAYKTAWDTQLAEVNANATAKIEALKASLAEQIGSISSDTKHKVRDLIDDIEDAIDVHSETVVNQVTDMTENIKTAMETPDWVSIGTNIVAGIQKGILDKAKDLAETAARVAREALEAAEEALDINSPSGEFRNVGMYSDLGFAAGLTEYSYVVKRSSENVATTALGVMKNSVSKISDLVENGMDPNPTIRPVVDLSAVEIGISKINSMFSRQDVITASNAFNKSINEKLQNDGISTAKGPTVFEMKQYNYSPTALSRIDIYRQTKNQFSELERMVRP